MSIERIFRVLNIISMSVAEAYGFPDSAAFQLRTIAATGFPERLFAVIATRMLKDLERNSNLPRATVWTKHNMCA